MNRLTKYVLLASSLLMAVNSQADDGLYRVGPNDLPSPPGNGYPLWYQDTNGLALDLCVPQSLNQLDACLATPAPGDPLPTLPYVFPGNWPDEFFWFGAETALDFGGGNTALLVQAVEAAFALGPAAEGDQIAFARIRIRIDAPVDGTYTVTYPYGQEVFPNISAGGSAVFYTSDVGIGAAGDFTGALHGAIGPFLTAVDAFGTPKPFFPIDGDSFLSNPATTTQVTGSPFQLPDANDVLQDTNYFEICVDNPEGRGLNGGIGGARCVRTDEFFLIGKVHTAPIASPLSVERATYSTHVDSLTGLPMPEAHVDVFASAEGGLQIYPDLTLGMAGAPSVHMIGPRNPGGRFYGEGIVDSDRNTRPSSVTVINSADNPPSSVTADLVDSVTISVSSYDATSGVLSIEAMSSDMADPPSLAAIGIPGSLTGSDALIGGSLSVTLPPGMVPPETISVKSAWGGRATATVTMPAHGDPFPTGAPLAVDDNVSANECVAAPCAATNIAVLANDGAEAVAGSLSLLSTPTNGTAAANTVTGTVDYTPNVGYFGADSFQYTVSSVDLLSSNIATVNITVQQFNNAPVANDDTANAPGGSVTVDVVANDTDADGIEPAAGGLDPATVIITSVSPFASTFNNSDGTVLFTALGCETTASCAFTYTVSDIGVPALTSNVATVTITSAVNQAPIAADDAASVIVDQSVTINVAANDSDPEGALNLDSIVVTFVSNGSALVNADGTIDFGAGPNSGVETVVYTIADDQGTVSNPATVTVTVRANPEVIGVQRAQCKSDKEEWRVDGTSSNLTPHFVSIYAGNTVAGGTLIASNLQVDNLGAWRMSKNNTSGVACTSPISVLSSFGGKAEGIAVNVN